MFVLCMNRPPKWSVGLFVLRIVPDKLSPEGIDDIKDVFADIGEIPLHKGFR